MAAGAHQVFVFSQDRHPRIVSSIAIQRCPSLLTEGNWMAGLDFTFGWLERMKMNHTAVTQRLISFSGVLQEDVNSPLSSSLLASFFPCFLPPLSSPLPYDMPEQLFGKRRQMTKVFVSRTMSGFKIRCMRWKNMRPPFCVALFSFWWKNDNLVTMLTHMIQSPFHHRINWTVTLGRTQFLSATRTFTTYRLLT